ncbi:autophagy protein 5 [Actinomortierella ambigua]|nr:autophagy protein 5 [Actinomortierella ambigua]
MHTSAITRAVWDGSIPIQFTWDQAEAKALGSAAVESFFVEAPRCSYFSLLTSQVRKHFVDMALHFIGDDAEVWYDYEGTPLKWHYPIGLLYDLHGIQASSNKPGARETLLPWKVTVHFQNFPADRLIKSQAVDICQDYFMSMIKEADFLRNGSTKKVMNMSKADQTQLWDGLWSNQPRSLRQVLNVALPDLFPLDQDPSTPPPATAMVHGVTPSLDTGAVWASQNMSYPDNFLHIVVLFNS